MITKYARIIKNAKTGAYLATDDAGACNYWRTAAYAKQDRTNIPIYCDVFTAQEDIDNGRNPNYVTQRGNMVRNSFPDMTDAVIVLMIDDEVMGVGRESLSK